MGLGVLAAGNRAWAQVTVQRAAGRRCPALLTALLLVWPLFGCRPQVALVSEPAAEAYVVAARQREAAGDPLGALSDLRSAVELFPHSLEVWRELARLAANMNQLQEALGAYQRLNQAQPEDAALASGLAQLALHVGDLELAESTATRLCRSPSAGPEDLVLAARIAFEAGAEERCQERAKAALALQPELPEAHYRLAQIAAGRGEHQTARAGYERVLASDPGHAGACFALGTLLAQTSGEPNQGERAAWLQACAQVCNDLSSVGFKSAPPLERIARAEQAAQLHPTWARGHLELARALLETGRAAEAEQALVRAQAGLPKLREVLLLRARAAEALGRPKQAAKWMLQWQQSSP